LGKSNISTYQYGNTVRFECTFYNFNNEKVNPDLVKVIVYNYKYEILLEEIINSGINIGEYMYDYTTGDKSEKLYYEWYGEIDGNPSIKRKEFQTRFI